MKIKNDTTVRYVNCENARIVSEMHYEFVGRWACYWLRWKNGETCFGQISQRKFFRRIDGKSADIMALMFTEWGSRIDGSYVHEMRVTD
jgi:hypothetical protein